MVGEYRKAYMKKYRKEYYIKNKGKLSKQMKKYYKENKKHKREYDRKYYQEHKEKLKVQVRKYGKKNSNKKKEMNKNYFMKNKDKHNKQSLKWAKENRDKVNKSGRKWRKTEGGKLSMKKNNIKRRVLEGKDTLTKEELKTILKRDKVCVYCSSNKKLTFEHIIPLSKYGGNSFLNSVLACLSCNSSKKDKDVFEWCKEQNIEVPKIVLSLLNKQKKLCKGV